MRWWILVSKICKFFSWTTEKNGRIYQHGLYRLIADREMSEPYLHRYYLFSTRWLKRWFPKLSYRLVLHKCVKSDADGLHDHPWDWKSKILEGGYHEHRSWGKPVYRRPGGWRSSRATDFHRLELPRGCPHSWSLFLMGPKIKDWGFQDRNGDWIQWEEYINNRHMYM
jgi:hypothetical protein